MSRPRILVAVAWPYANGPFHIGHLAGAYLPGDIFARYHRLRGDDVLMVSGSDMHGTPVLVRAEAEGVAPPVIAERFHEVNRSAFERLGISFDVYTSTRTPLHERTVDEIFLALLRNGFIDRRTAPQAFCPKHQRFLPDRYLRGECPHCGNPAARGDECDRCGRTLQPSELLHPVCALCGTPVEFRPSEHFYLRLDKLSDPVDRFLSDKRFWRPNVVTFVENFRRAGLHPTPITRDIDWGVPLPLDGYPTKRFYVWFEAVIGYLSASKEWALRRGEPDAWKRFWDPEAPVRGYYFVGKDNIYHHSVFWPAMLLGVGGLAPPYDVAANEWLVLEGKKLSKSAPGGDVAVASMLERYPVDAIRFYAALQAPQHHDTEFSFEELRQSYEQVLANQWGNLVQRLLVFVRDRSAGRVPFPPEDPAVGGSQIFERLRGAHARITQELEAVHLKEALELIFTEVREANRRFHDAKPWQAADPERDRALYEGLWFLSCASVWLSPYLPGSCARLRAMLGVSEAGAGDWDRALEPPTPGTELGREVRPLYPKSEPPPTPPSGPPPAGSAASGPIGARGGPAPFEIRAARIDSVEPHPSADKLYRLELDVGPIGRRTVVAGLRPFLPAEALLGERVLLLANLEPRTIRSVRSEGMLLASESDGTVRLLHPPPECAVGDAADGTETPCPTIQIQELERTPLRVGRVVGAAKEGASRIDAGERTVRAPGEWPLDALVVVRLDPDGARGTVIAFRGGRPAVAEPSVRPGAKVR